MPEQLRGDHALRRMSAATTQPFDDITIPDTTNPMLTIPADYTAEYGDSTIG